MREKIVAPVRSSVSESCTDITLCAQWYSMRELTVSLWQNGHVERLIGSIRRECLDHMIVLGEAHLRGVLKSYAAYYTRRGRIYRWTSTRRTFGVCSRSAQSWPCRS